MLALLLKHWRRVAAVAVAVALVAAGWGIRDYQARGEALAASHAKMAEMIMQGIKYESKLNAERLRTEARDTELTALRQKKERIITRTRTEYVKAPYTDCPMPADGLSIIRDAEADVLR